MSASTLTDRTRIDVGAVTERLAVILSRHSIDILRVALGLVFLGFGVLKFVPDLSPAEPLVVRTLDTLSFGLVPATAAMVLTATMETFIGLALVSGKFLRTGLVVLATAFVGIMSPVVLFAGDMFGDGPTLEAQYVLKDVVLIAAGLVVGAKALGARLVAPRPIDSPTDR